MSDIRPPGTQQDFVAEFEQGSLFYRLVSRGRRFVSIDYPVTDVLARKRRELEGPDGTRSYCALEVGSGFKRLGTHFLNLDIYPFANVDVVGDVHRLPFRDAAFEGVWLIDVLEHLADPSDVVPELYRVVKPGGHVLATISWMHPWHGAPSDYQRLSLDSLAGLFTPFHCDEVKVWRGPTVALLNFLASYFALFTFTSNKRLHLLIKALLLLPTFWLKYLDKLLTKSPTAFALAESYYYLGTKR